ncbi:pilus protein [Salmonella enterica]|nr:pilus protein [Salmonella enterica]
MPGAQATARQGWRDRSGRCKPGFFASGMEARQGGDSSAGSVHDSPPRQGDARKRHWQENNKTASNQGSSNQNQNRRKKRTITGKVM